MRGINAVLVVLATLVASASAGFTEARTGIAFPDKLGGKPLNRLGVRTKGPIKVYAVGEYGDTFLLQMSYGVGAAKMSAALGDALKPRCGDSKLIADFEACLTKGLPNGAPKGTKLQFDTSGGGVGISVNGKSVGSVSGKPLASAFSGIYCDGNAVCKMNSVDDVGSDGEVGGGEKLITPVRLGMVGAAVGWGIGKLVC